MGRAVDSTPPVQCPSRPRIGRCQARNFLNALLLNSVVKTRRMLLLTWILSVVIPWPSSPYSHCRVLSRERSDAAGGLLFARGQESHAGESPSALEYKIPLPLVPDKIRAVQNHLESGHHRLVTGGVSFRCQTAARLFSHSFQKLGPSLVSCCARNAADTLEHQKAILANPDKSGLLEPLLDLQEQLETENYEIAVRNVREKYGDLYARVRKTDARMHALLEHHELRGRPLVPGNGDIQVGPPKRCSKGIAAFSLSGCAAIRFVKAEAAATARAAVTVAYERGLLAQLANQKESFDIDTQTQEATGASHEKHGAKLSDAYNATYNSSSSESKHRDQDADADYLTGIARAAHARIRSYVVDLDEICVRSAVHVLSERPPQEVPEVTDVTAGNPGDESGIGSPRKYIREVSVETDARQALPLTIEQE
ncbi:hypothetical protein CSUI_002829 [Cystoisospora suis]|uniref:Uncharacterized protein n=1 Tax=Cystoisospora suis TaxID=483139 RepID=A0A2C6L4Z3_9APIC|nr:hypothetical protein CSUI_002829 [Cystoisospora suis]